VGLESVLGYRALSAGLLPLTVAIVVVAPLAGRLADRIGAKLPVTIGTIHARRTPSATAPHTADPRPSSRSRRRISGISADWPRSHGPNGNFDEAASRG